MAKVESERIETATMSSFFIGLPYGEFHKEKISLLREFVKKYPYDLIAFPHVIYPKPEDEIVYQMVTAIKEDVSLENKEAVGENSYLTWKQLSSYYLPNELSLTVSFLDLVNFTFSIKRGNAL